MIKAKSNSEPYLEHVFRQYHASLYFYALKFIDNSEVAKDLVQDAFFSLLSSTGKADIKNVKAYLFTSVRNNCLNYIKREKVTSEFARKEHDRLKREIQFYDIHRSFVEKELQQQLLQAINELPEKYRTPFSLSRFEDFSNKEIAEKLKLPIRTVETQIFRALKILRKKFKNSGVFWIVVKKNNLF